MLKILIVDDEILVQVGLSAMLRALPGDYEICGTAGNGKEALKLIEQCQPDLVFSDIKMPLMDGLTLLGESERLFGPVPVFVMLTAYEDFEMARQAMASQAAAYLVKMELSPETLQKALDTAARRLEERRGHPASPGGESPSLEEYREKLLLQLLSGKITDREELDRLSAPLGLSFAYNRYVVCAGELASPAEDPKAVSRAASAAQMARDIVSRRTPVLYASPDVHHLCLLFYFQEELSLAEGLSRIQDALENARQMIGGYFSLPLRFGIGTAVSSALDAAESYEEACSALAATGEESPVLFFSHIAGSNRRSGKDKLIAAIQAYIDENLEGKLVQAEVAEAFGLSSSYLSTIFKKNTFVSFSEYVAGQKIERAKHLLLEGDMKVYEVADALGFESAYYFSKVFKKVEGMSPREFIQKKTESGEP